MLTSDNNALGKGEVVSSILPGSTSFSATQPHETAWFCKP